MIDTVLLDAIPLCFFFLICITIKLAPRGNLHTDYLSKDKTTTLRGIMAIGIVLHHMSERVTGGYLFPQMVHAGYLLVSTFFFLSGYGLIVQYQKRRDSYLKGFLRKRLLYLVIVYLLDVAAYTVFDLLMGKTHSVLEIIQSIYMGGIAKNAWYMIVLIVFYACFWIIFRLLPNVPIRVKIFLVFLCQLAFIGVCLVTGRNGVWYVSNFGFSLGMLWACEKERIDALAERRYWLLLGTLLFGFAFLSALPVVLERLLQLRAYDNVPRTICRLISTPLSSAILILLLVKVRFTGKLWAFLGEISLEIYLLHGMAYTFFRSERVYLDSEALWVICTVAASILMAIPASKLNRAIAVICKRDRSRKGLERT